MRSKNNFSQSLKGRPAYIRLPARALTRIIVVLTGMLPLLAHASMFKGEALDTVANVMAWVVLIIAPIVGITVFWLVHILPEKIAEKKQHPQAKAIQTLCLLSLFFGGLLWPLAWLWAYTKPVLHQMAYGTDKVAHDAYEAPHSQGQQVSAKADEVRELQQLRQRIDELEARLGASPSGSQASGS